VPGPTRVSSSLSIAEAICALPHNKEGHPLFGFEERILGRVSTAP
jgi:hypothetical protein